MAMTGGTAYLVKSERTNSGQNDWTTDLYIYVKIVSQNPIANTSTIALGMYVYSKYNIDWGDWSNGGQSYVGTATSGANCFTFTQGQTGSGTKWLTENHEVTVTHNSDGTLTLPIYWHWGVYSTWGQYLAPSGSKNVTLTAIDRTAPTVTFSTSAITANGFTISATSSATADIWQYSTNNGSSWTQFSTTAGTSASKAITGLSPNTSYTVKVRARKKTNQVYGTSSAVTVKTLGGAIVNSATQVTADAATVTLKVNVTVYDASYTYTLDLKNGSTTIVSIGGLSWSKGTADRTVTLTAANRTALLTAMASMKSFTGTFAVSTFNGSTQIGATSSKTATVTTTAANSSPTLSGFTYADSYATTTAITGNDQLFIQGYSKLTVTPGTATPKNNATLSGALAPAKLSAAVPISKGGTGATTAAAARTNLAVLPLAGGTLTGQVTSSVASSQAFLVSHGTANKDAGFRATRTDTDVSLFFGVGSGGVNHGLYSTKLGKWLVYGDGSNVYCTGTATNVTGTVAVAHGGTGATTAAAARTNLGITCTSLYNGSLSSGSITFNYGNYNAYIILGQPGSATAIAGIVIPKGIITTSDVKYQITDESYYRCFTLKYSGSTVTLTISTGSGTVSRVFGLT